KAAHSLAVVHRVDRDWCPHRIRESAIGLSTASLVASGRRGTIGAQLLSRRHEHLLSAHRLARRYARLCRNGVPGVSVVSGPPVPPLRLSRSLPPLALGHLGERQLAPLCTPVPSSTASYRGHLCRGGIRLESTPRLPRHCHATGPLDAVAHFSCCGSDFA